MAKRSKPKRPPYHTPPADFATFRERAAILVGALFQEHNAQTYPPTVGRLIVLLTDVDYEGPEVSALFDKWEEWEQIAAEYHAENDERDAVEMVEEEWVAYGLGTLVRDGLIMTLDEMRNTDPQTIETLVARLDERYN